MKGELHLPFSLVQQEKGKGWRLERKRRSGKHVDLEEAGAGGRGGEDLHHKGKPQRLL